MNKKKILICGGGSTYTLPLLKTLSEFTDSFPIAEIKLYDIDKSKQEMIYQAGKIVLDEVFSGIELSQYYDDAAFKDIDFAFLQIRSGGLSMRAKDEHIPLSYGCVGQETCGAGGFAYGLRSVKEVLALIGKIRAENPNAWIINYSNPAAIVAVATNRMFPDDDKIINLCDMPIAMMDGFAQAFNLVRQDLTPRYFGLNHFGWFTHLYDKDGNDLLPQLKEMLKDKGLMPKELNQDQGWIETFEQLGTMVSDLNGYVPNTYLQYYLYPNQMVKHSDPNYTRADYVMENRLKQVEKECEYIIRNRTVKGSGLEKGVHGLYIVELANSLISNKERTFIAIVRNNGIIPNLPSDAMVEVPCLVSEHGLEPLHVGEIDVFYKGLLETQYAYETLTVKAALEEDYDAALKALVLNRTVVDVEKAKSILKDLMEANKSYWKLRGN